MKIKATTLSVILRDSTTVHCYVSVNGAETNLTLRFDRGNIAMLCGYPQTWDVHDVNVDPYDSESPTGSDLYECDAPSDDRTYISAETEAEILRKLKRSIEQQFNDCSWMEMELTLKFQLEILDKINNAIFKLQCDSITYDDMLALRATKAVSRE